MALAAILMLELRLTSYNGLWKCLRMRKTYKIKYSNLGFQFNQWKDHTMNLKLKSCTPFFQLVRVILGIHFGAVLSELAHNVCFRLKFLSASFSLSIIICFYISKLVWLSNLMSAFPCYPSFVLPSIKFGWKAAIVTTFEKITADNIEWTSLWWVLLTLDAFFKGFCFDGCSEEGNK